MEDFNTPFHRGEAWNMALARESMNKGEKELADIFQRVFTARASSLDCNQALAYLFGEVFKLWAPLETGTDVTLHNAGKELLKAMGFRMVLPNAQLRDRVYLEILGDVPMNIPDGVQDVRRQHE